MQIAPLQLSVRLALLLAAVCAVFLMIGGPAEADTPGASPIEHVVKSGDTLWNIAVAHATPGSDVRRVIHDIRTLSGFSGGIIVHGQVLLIPAG